MHSELVIDVDIQSEDKTAKNMMNQIQEIINGYRGYQLDRGLFDSVVGKIQKKHKYFCNHDFPPMFILITMYGVALVDKKQKRVKLAEQAIMSSNYRLTEEQKQRGSIF